MRLAIEPPTPSTRSIICTQDGCRRGTKHGKTYCSDHVNRMDYAQRVSAELERRATESALLSKDVRLPRDSHMVREAFALLWEYRRISAPGLTRHISLNHDEAETLLRSLADHGLATIRRSPRGLEATCTYDEHALPDLDAADA